MTTPTITTDANGSAPVDVQRLVRLSMADLVPELRKIRAAGGLHDLLRQLGGNPNNKSVTRLYGDICRRLHGNKLGDEYLASFFVEPNS